MPMLLPELLPELTTSAGRFILKPYSDNDVEALTPILLDDRLWDSGYGDGEIRPATAADVPEYAAMRYTGHRIFSVYTNPEHFGYSQFIGTTGIIEIKPDDERCKIGRTLLDPNFWGMGVNQEVKSTFMEWIFSCGTGRVECDVNSVNERCINSLIHFGFSLEAIRRRYSPRGDGTWKDLALLALVVEDWEEQQRTGKKPSVETALTAS